MKKSKRLILHPMCSQEQLRNYFKMCFLIISKDTLRKDLKRVKRGTHRGQTQSQYLSFGGEDDGKAEAEATHVRKCLIFKRLNHIT